ncbi:MAG: hypothetical protein NTV04_12940 [Deltaproteobacteria bacterium]|nr:hypothetical protein [Deltaproteobacteria bacterium]
MESVQKVFLRFGDLADQVAQLWFPFRQAQITAQIGVGRQMDSGLGRTGQIEGNPIGFPVMEG